MPEEPERSIELISILTVVGNMVLRVLTGLPCRYRREAADVAERLQPFDGSGIRLRGLYRFPLGETRGNFVKLAGQLPPDGAFCCEHVLRLDNVRPQVVEFRLGRGECTSTPRRAPT